MLILGEAIAVVPELSLAEELRACPAYGGIVQVPVELANRVYQALADAAEFVVVKRMEM